MSAKPQDFQVLPCPPERQVIVEGGRIASHRHTVMGLIEVDVTRPRCMIQTYKARAGEAPGERARLCG